jgi:hypothetical protein
MRPDGSGAELLTRLGGATMKRLLLLLALVVVVLGLIAAPAYAFYAPQHETAYIDAYFQPRGWVELVGPDYRLVVHVGAPIPRDWPVVVAISWLDARPGAEQIPAHEHDLFTFTRTTGGPKYSVDTLAESRKYWSPIYLWDPVNLPGIYARDWWVPLGTLPPGTYTGAYHTWADEPFPTWTDEDLNLLEAPVLYPVWDVTVPHTFRVQ